MDDPTIHTELIEVRVIERFWETFPPVWHQVRAFVDKSGDTVRWLEDMGLDIPWISPYYPNQTPLTWHTPKNGGSDIVHVLIKKCEKLGVNYLLNTTINKLIKNEILLFLIIIVNMYKLIAYMI